MSPRPCRSSSQNNGKRSLLLRLAAAPPQPVSITEAETAISVPSGASRFSGAPPPSSAAIFAVRSVYAQTESPLGLWHVRSGVPVDCNLRVYPNLRDQAPPRLSSSAMRRPARACAVNSAKAGSSTTCASTFPATASKISTGRPPPAAVTPSSNSTASRTRRKSTLSSIRPASPCARASSRSYVEAALHLALVAERQGDRFGLVTFSDRTHNFVRARSGMNHFRLCRETIYNLQRHPRKSGLPRGLHQSATQPAQARAACLLHFARRRAPRRDLRARSRPCWRAVTWCWST